MLSEGVINQTIARKCWLCFIWILSTSALPALHVLGPAPDEPAAVHHCERHIAAALDELHHVAMVAVRHLLPVNLDDHIALADPRPVTGAPALDGLDPGGLVPAQGQPVPSLVLVNDQSPRSLTAVL